MRSPPLLCLSVSCPCHHYHHHHPTTGEGKLLALIWQAGSGDQVQAALDLVRWDRMNRARLHQVAHISTHVTRALLKVGGWGCIVVEGSGEQLCWIGRVPAGLRW